MFCVSLALYKHKSSTRVGYHKRDAFKSFCDCEGGYLFRPFHDHVLEFWKGSLNMPDNILFLKYEDTKRDPRGQVKKLASFLGKPIEDKEMVYQILIWDQKNNLTVEIRDIRDEIT
ncbi:Sulfotransferase domain [Dillenia turbinata]|uniref:Sulfotransferase n=1 Tax=Dillenia turbinata TaxID=194707 RepID=A0AAN8UDF5_9MAGN